MIDQQQAVVAERDGVPVACACVDYLGVVQPFLAAVWVLDEHRRRGVGRAILRFLEDHLRARGHSVLYSSCVVDEKPPQDWHRFASRAPGAGRAGRPLRRRRPP
jgi:GNAT superfamily N-acetyltransferase